MIIYKRIKEVIKIFKEQEPKKTLDLLKIDVIDDICGTIQNYYKCVAEDTNNFFLQTISENYKITEEIIISKERLKYLLDLGNKYEKEMKKMEELIEEKLKSLYNLERILIEINFVDFTIYKVKITINKSEEEFRIKYDSRSTFEINIEEIKKQIDKKIVKYFRKLN